MTDGVQKLRALAKQSRLLARQVPDRERERALRGLAQLYEEQAREEELSEAIT